MKKKAIWCLTILILLFPGCESKQVKVVARIGNKLLTLDDFEQAYYRTKPITMAAENKMEDKKVFLNELVSREMKLQLARQLRINEIPEIAAQLQEAKKRAAYIATLEQLVMYKIISDDEIRDFYEKSDLEIRVRQILLSAKGDTSRKNLDGLYEKGVEIIQSLRSGADFFEMVRKYSDDEFTSRKGGDLGFLKWGAMDSSFMEAALKTHRYQIYPTPIRTPKGMHVIQVMDRRKLLRKPYEVARNEIVQWLFNKYRTEVLQEFERFNINLEKENDVRFLSRNLEQTVDFLKLDVTDSLFKTYARGRNPDVSWIPENTKKMTLIEYAHQTFAVADLVRLLAKRPNPIVLKEIDVETIKRVSMDAIRLDLTAGIGFKNGYLNVLPYNRELRNQLEQIILNKLRVEYLEKEKVVSDEMLKTYFEKNRKRYEQPAMADIQEILVPDSLQSVRIYNEAISGADFNKLAKEFNTRFATKNRNGMLGKVAETSLGMIGKVSLESPVGAIKGPIPSVEGFSIIKVLSKEPQKIPDFDQVKNQVRADLKGELKRETTQKWETEMQRRFHVRKYEDVLQLAFNEIS